MFKTVTATICCHFIETMVLAPPVGFEPTTNWLTASASDRFYQRQPLYRTEPRRHNNDYLSQKLGYLSLHSGPGKVNVVHVLEEYREVLRGT